MEKKILKNPFKLQSSSNNDNIELETEHNNASANSPSQQQQQSTHFGLPPEPTDFMKKAGISESSLKFGLNIGKQMFEESKVSSYLSLNILKPYFEVDNKYVLYKLKNIFFPFYLFQSSPSLDALQQQNSSDAEDNMKLTIEYPDLYIPIMSFITYVLLIGFSVAYKTNTLFDPKILGKIASKNFFIAVLECSALKILLFMFSNMNLPFLDCFAYIGYKFVLLVFCLITWLFTMNIGKLPLYIVLGIISVLSMLYLQHCLKKRVTGQNKFQRVMVYVASCLEVVTISLILLDLYFY